MIAAIIDLRLYPFLADVEELVSRRYGLPLSRLLELRRSLVEDAFNRVESVVKEGRIPGPKQSLEEEVLTHYLASVAVSLVSDKWLVSRFALAEANRAYHFMRNEPDEVIASIARSIGLRTLVYRKAMYKEPIAMVRGVLVYQVYDYSIRFVEYVTVARRLLGDPSWKPVNMPVFRGNVFLKREQVLRVIKEALTSFIEEKTVSIAKGVDEEVVNLVKPLVERINKLLAETRRPRIRHGGKTFIPKGVIVEEAFPPCISDLVVRARQGENLSHHERFALATFMLNIGADIDSVVDLFRNMPDFNEKITRYQVEHLAGLRGSGKKYSVYSCEKMKTLGICKADCGTRSPVQAYYRNIRKMAKHRE